MKKVRNTILITLTAILALTIGCSMPGSYQEDQSNGAKHESSSRALGVTVSLNPYANVNWSTFGQYKANYHTHTTNSDGSQSPSTVINEYGSKGYKILSLTDHNYTTWSWPHNNYNLLAIKGNEYSSSHHMNAFLNFSNNSGTLENGIPHVQSHGGISMINHPGRYRSPSEWSWYIPWFRDYSSAVALEVINKADGYPNDRKLWDNINENLFTQSGKLVWGISDDDKHSTSQLYSSFNFMLMPNLTETAWKESMETGASYFCYEPGKSGNANVPRISSIVVDNNAKTITITASGYNSIEWIGPGTSVVGTGNIFHFSSYTDKPFVRAVLHGPQGDSYTQPFGFTTNSGPVNVAPSLSLTAPSQGAHYNSPQTITLSANASDSDGSVTGVEFFVNGASIGNDSSAPYSRSYALPANGAYTLTAVATDDQGATTASSAVSITVGVTATTTSARINSSMNDVEERSNGSVYTNSSDIELVYDGSNQTVGLRFVGLNIPQGANITSANIQFTCDETNSGTTNLLIRGHDTNNSSAFTTSSYNVSSRSKTSASVSWSPSAWNSVGQAGSAQRTPDISAVIQEIVNRSGYGSSSAITILITGTGERTAESYDGSSSRAALLTVEYTTGGAPVNAAPVANAGTNQSVMDDDGNGGETVYFNGSSSYDSDGSIASYVWKEGSSQIGTGATFSKWLTVGTHNITLTVTDNDGASDTDQMTVTVTAVSTEPTTISKRISSGNDDVEEAPDGGIYRGSSDIEMIYDRYNGGNQVVGLRFKGLAIPQGATITNAYIQFTVDERNSGTTNLTIKGHDTDDAPYFSTSSYNVSNRTKTSATVYWNNIPSWNSVGASGGDQRTPNIASIVGEIVNRSGWSSGNDMVFIISGTGERTAESYNGSSSKAPLLVVTYQ
jgi:hypothetical protein